MSEVARGRRESLAGVLRHPDLRRLSAGWASFFLVDALSVVAVSVWAFDRGGTTAVGVVGLLRLLPAGMAGPLGAWMADRYSRRAVMVTSFAGMVVIQGALCVSLGIDAPVGVAYTLVALGGIVATAYRPAQLAVVPLVVRSPDELVAVNVTTGLVEGAVTFAGPALAAVLLVIASPTAVAGAASIAALLGLLAVAGLRVSSDPSRAVRRRPDSPIKAISAGFSELRQQPDVGILIGAGAVQLLVRGMLMVLLVPVAIDLLDLENSAVGWLAAAMGIGGIVGALLATSLAGRRRLAMPFAMSLVLWGAPIAVIGIAPHVFVAVAAMAVIGFGNSRLDISVFTLVQRLGNDTTLARVFGVLYTLGAAIAGAASLATPALVSAVGLRPALIVTGMILPVLTLLILPRLRRIDDRAEPVPEVVSTLAHISLLAPLPPTTIEKLAARATAAAVPAGEDIVREGEPGSDFYGIVSGEVEVVQGGQRRRTLHAGDHFGEIALLEGGARTATVRALDDVSLVSVPATHFLDALCGSEAAAELAHRHTTVLLDGDIAAGDDH